MRIIYMKTVVVGCGFSGAVIARKLAGELGAIVTVVEKRSHVAGNMYDEYDEHSILVQRYGPHIVCTNNYGVLEYLSKYSEFFKYTVKLLSYIDGEWVRLPFNFETLQQLVGIRKAGVLLNKMRARYVHRDRVPILEIIGDPDEDISNYGNLLFEKAYRPYCAKQWGIPIQSIGREIMDRVPMAMSYDERYMNKDFQYLPKGGFTKLFENMLGHDNIKIILNTDANEHITFSGDTVLYDGEKIDCLVYTGAIDELFALKYGELPYRSLEFKYEYCLLENPMPADITSYPQAEGYTRKTDYRALMFDKSSTPGTTIATEYPMAFNKIGGTRYYPVLTEESKVIYNKYLRESEKYKSLFLCGRLAEFKYYNMDDCILHAFDVFERIKGEIYNS